MKGVAPVTFRKPQFSRRNLNNPALKNAGFTLLEISLAVVLLGVAVGIALPNLQKPYGRYQLQVAARQLVSDIRYIQQQQQQQQSINNPQQIYKIKFWSKYLSDGSKYEIWRDMEKTKEVKYKNIEIYYGGADLPFNGDPDGVRVLYFGPTGKIATKTGTVNLRDTISGEEVGVIVHYLRVRIGPPNEVDE